MPLVYLNGGVRGANRIFYLFVFQFGDADAHIVECHDVARLRRSANAFLPLLILSKILTTVEGVRMCFQQAGSGDVWHKIVRTFDLYDFHLVS